MVRHPYDGPQGTCPRHEVITAQAGGARSAIAAQAITRSWAPDVDCLRQSHHTEYEQNVK